MAKFTFEDILYNRVKKVETFDFDSLVGPGIYNLLYESDLQSLYNIATSIKYSAQLKKKYKAIDDILRPRGFAHFHRGTNRVVYKHYENQNILIKAPIDLAGCTDGMMEFRNQNLLKPFVSKVFDVHPSGVSVHERVVPLTTYADFSRFAYEYFELVSHVFLGRYVMDDIGEGSFMNWGFRYGFGLVLLDFPYLYELDSQRLVCHKVSPTGEICFGEIDYDDGFNHLICKKCGASYNAKEIGKFIQDHQIYLVKEEKGIMARTTFVPHVVIMSGDRVVEDLGRRVESDVILPKKKFDAVQRQNRVTTINKKEESITKPTCKAKNNLGKLEEDTSKITFKFNDHKESEKREEVVTEDKPSEPSEVENYIEELVNKAEEEDSKYDNEQNQESEDEYVNEEREESQEESQDEEQKEVEVSEERFQESSDNIETEESSGEQENEKPAEQSTDTNLDWQNQEKVIDQITNAVCEENDSRNAIRHIVNLLLNGYTVQDISAFIERSKCTPEQYTKYMSKANKIAIMLNKKEVNAEVITSSMSAPEESVTEESDVESANETDLTNLESQVFDILYNIMEQPIKSDDDPSSWIDGAEGKASFSPEEIAEGLKHSLELMVPDEFGGEGQLPCPENIDNILDHVVQTLILNHKDYIAKWSR